MSAGLRCKVGDLAVVVASTDTPQLVGMFVVVERPLADGEFVFGVRIETCGAPSWMVRSAAEGGSLPALCTWGDGTQELLHLLEVGIRDAHLRPIRDNNGEDETMSWSRPNVGEVA